MTTFSLTTRSRTVPTFALILTKFESDKKLSKATNAQVIELNPVMTLEQAKSFKHGFRNVIVLKKMTFPNDKVLTIEMSEKQISGRNILLSIDYEDVLSADSFNAVLLEEE